MQMPSEIDTCATQPRFTVLPAISRSRDPSVNLPELAGWTAFLRSTSHCAWARPPVNVFSLYPAQRAFLSLLNCAKEAVQQRADDLELKLGSSSCGALEVPGRARSVAQASVALAEMDGDGNTKRSRPGRRPTKKLKFKPKVPPQKPRKLAAEKPEQEQPAPVDEELIKILRTPQKAEKTLPKTEEERSKQSPPPPPPSAAVVSLSSPQSGVYKQNHSTTLQSPRAFPVTANPGMLYNKEEEEYDDDEDDDNDSDDDNVEFQENQQSSIECEASTHPAEELGLLKEKERKERMFLFQLPKTLPLPRRSSIVERKGKTTSREVKEGSNLQQLPQGYLGKMLVYKSGKMKMKIGDVMFDVNPGAESRMMQHLAAVNCKEKHCCLLGEIENRHVIVTPDVDSLLNNN